MFDPLNGFYPFRIFDLQRFSLNLSMAELQAHMDGVLSGSLAARDALLEGYAAILQGPDFFTATENLCVAFSSKAEGIDKLEPFACTMRAIMGQTVRFGPDHSLKEFPDGFWTSDDARIRAAIALCYAKTFNLGAPDFVTRSALGFLKARLKADPSLRDALCTSYATIANVFASRGYGAWSVWRRYLRAFHPIPAGTAVKVTDMDESAWYKGYVVDELCKSNNAVCPWDYILKKEGYEVCLNAYLHGVLPEDCVLDIKVWKKIIL